MRNYQNLRATYPYNGRDLTFDEMMYGVVPDDLVNSTCYDILRACKAPQSTYQKCRDDSVGLVQWLVNDKSHPYQFDIDCMAGFMFLTNEISQCLIWSHMVEPWLQAIGKPHDFAYDRRQFYADKMAKKHHPAQQQLVRPEQPFVGVPVPEVKNVLSTATPAPTGPNFASYFNKRVKPASLLQTLSRTKDEWQSSECVQLVSRLFPGEEFDELLAKNVHMQHAIHMALRDSRNADYQRLLVGTTTNVTAQERQKFLHSLYSSKLGGDGLLAHILGAAPASDYTRLGGAPSYLGALVATQMTDADDREFYGDPISSGDLESWITEEGQEWRRPYFVEFIRTARLELARPQLFAHCAPSSQEFVALCAKRHVRAVLNDDVVVKPVVTKNYKNLSSTELGAYVTSEGLLCWGHYLVQLGITGDHIDELLRGDSLQKLVGDNGLSSSFVETAKLVTILKSARVNPVPVTM